ncbi:hypothetical protein P5673_015840 [Acropora cervicornis]|uniref:Stabilizer of axonemal microtubules 2 n=1 Tax=Acropora cervicornis TaxID=6130 RepID=A0AAD9QHI4_ACRCE|nr:hypothetical protein P5673_015840 [Acropora cervicornis]
MALSRQYTAETDNLLKEKGLKCVCELCDCGGYHRHQGCMKNSHKVKAVFQRPGMSDVKTDYQQTYTLHEDTMPRNPRKPLPRLRNPNPPPMDFRTVQRMDFIERKPEPLQFHKATEEYKTPEEKIDGKTVYAQDFVDRGPTEVVKITRPQTIVQNGNLKFQSATTHKQTFTPKIPSPQVPFAERPCFTGSILYPDKESKYDVKTWNQDVYRGKFAARPEAFKPKEAQITIGTEGDHLLTTVHKAEFTKPEQGGRREVKVQKPTLKTEKRSKFRGDTQAKSDFPGFGTKMPLPPKPCSPPPATLRLAMNNSQDFETTNKEFYKISWDPSKMERTKILKPESGEYVQPEVKFASTTITKEDFKKRETARMPKIRPPSRIEPSKAKFFSETAYSAQFKPYKKVPFVRYGDFHETNFYQKPVVKFYQDGSVTAQDFKGAEGGRPRTTMKPEEKLEKINEKMTGHTSYSEAYSRKKLPQCSYLEWRSKHLAKKALATV